MSCSLKGYDKKATFFELGFLALLALVAFGISTLPFVASFHISPLIVAVILGIIITNAFGYKIDSKAKENALGFATKEVLRLGIILYGFRLSFNDILHVGFAGISMAIFIAITTLIIGIFIGTKLGLDKKLAALVSIGSAVCGAAAVLALESVVKGGTQKTVLAVATVVVFGTLGMFLYPLFYSFGLYDFSESTMGLLVGGTLHEVAHVVGAGAGISEVASHNAVIVKMMRVLMLVPIIILFGFLENKEEKTKAPIPWFAILFIVAIVINSLITIPKNILDTIAIFDTFLLTVAMAALGLKTHFKELIAVGKRAFILAFILFIWLGVSGFFFISAIS